MPPPRARNERYAVTTTDGSTSWVHSQRVSRAGPQASVWLSGPGFVLVTCFRGRFWFWFLNRFFQDFGRVQGDQSGRNIAIWVDLGDEMIKSHFTRSTLKGIEHHVMSQKVSHWEGKRVPKINRISILDVCTHRKTIQTLMDFRGQNLEKAWNKRFHKWCFWCLRFSIDFPMTSLRNHLR